MSTRKNLGILTPEPEPDLPYLGADEMDASGEASRGFQMVTATLKPMSTVVTADLAEDYAYRLADRLGDRLVRVSLFGSRARGEERRRSDYDLMVVIRRPTGKHRSVVHGLAAELELDLDYTVDLSTKIIDEARFDELRRSSLPFWRRFARDEKILWPPTTSARE